jgi:hypothetical protein
MKIKIGTEIRLVFKTPTSEIGSMHEHVVNLIVLNEMLNTYSFAFRRFLQGSVTDPAIVRKIRDAIDSQTKETSKDIPC